MQQFTIPQFIDVEDKIIGPITTRQFVIILGGIMFMFVFYKVFDFSLFVSASVIVFMIVVAFAFVKVNGRPFHFFLLNIVQTLKRPRLRIWNNAFGKNQAITQEIGEKIEIGQPIQAKHYTSSRLAELSLMVDTGGAFEGDGEEKQLERR